MPVSTHYEGRHFHSRRVYHAPQFEQVSRAVAYRPSPSELYLDKPVPVVLRMDERITFWSGIVPAKETVAKLLKKLVSKNVYKSDYKNVTEKLLGEI